MASGLSNSPIQATARIVARTPPRWNIVRTHQNSSTMAATTTSASSVAAGSIDSGRSAPASAPNAHRAIVGDRRRRQAAAETGRQRHQLKRDRDEREDEREIQPAVRAAADGGRPEQGEQGDAARQRHDRQEIGMGECEERPADEQDEHAQSGGRSPAAAARSRLVRLAASA